MFIVKNFYNNVCLQEHGLGDSYFVDEYRCESLLFLDKKQLQRQ